jgi:cyclopropane fatty-acyl-phospholipid synthase-like methyltransferase
MSARLRSVVEQLDVRPDDRVLEIGCGLAPGGQVYAFFDAPSGRTAT